MKFSILTWYSIITIIFRCPATVDLLIDTSPKICRPYFQIRGAAKPYLTPYYDTYASSYVNKVTPYYEILDNKVLTPASVYGRKYGSPRLAQAQAYGQAQWEKSIQPEVSKLTDAVKLQYSQSFAPHVEKVVSVTGPYYAVARDNALQTYYGSLVPTYNILQPYAIQAYGYGNRFAVNTGIPYAKWAWASGVIFLDRTVWPRLRILYGENVEPQLVRIGERLGRYRDGKRLQAVVDEVDM
jgi:hypothetical protein